MMRRGLLLFTALALAACAQRATNEDPVQDPLRNTKKLIAEGHATLYRNGAFTVPATTIQLIPPGPDTLQLVKEMAGLRAAQSFRESLKHARESVDFAKAGVEKSVQAASTVQEASNDAALRARSLSKAGVETAGATKDVAITGARVTQSAAKATYQGTKAAGARISEGAGQSARELHEGTKEVTGDMLSGSAAAAREISQGSAQTAREHRDWGRERFVKGYARLPGKLSERGKNIATAGSLTQFTQAVERAEEWRAQNSGAMSESMKEARAHYGEDVAGSMQKAREELGKGAENGYTLAAMKSLAWLLRAAFWDATLKPAAKLGGATLGYLTVNAVAYPALIVFHEGVAVTQVAVQVTWNSVAGVYEIIAPTGEAALAGLLSVGEWTIGKAAAGAVMLGGAAVAGTSAAAGEVAAGGALVVGSGAGLAVQYVGAPLATLGVGAVGGAATAGATTATAAAGAGMVVVGTTGEATTRVLGAGAAGTTAAVGATASVAAGAALGAYELGKAVALPVGYEIGAGIVLSYDTLAQLSAQTILAASDAAYLVLSMEGPNWVIYAVSGKTESGEELPEGTLLDLRAMQKEGETFQRLPASDEEKHKIVETLQGELARPQSEDW